MALPAGRYGVTKNQLLKIKKLPMNTIKLIEELTEKFDLLGSAAFKNSTSVVTDSTDLVESGAVKDIVGWGNKNLCDPTNMGHGVRDTSTGRITSQSDNASSTTIPIKVKSSATYVISQNSVQIGSVALRVFYYGSDMTFISTELSNPFTIPSNAEYVAFQNGSNFGLDNWQMELGSTATAYEPYHESVEDTLRDAEVVEGKNLNYPSYNMYNRSNPFVQSGLTITFNKDGSVTINGTLTSRISIDIHRRVPNNNDSDLYMGVGNYKVSVNSGFQISAGTTYNSSAVNLTEVGTDVDLSITSATNSDYKKGNAILLAVYLWINAGTYNNAVIYPMISKDGGDYEPYYTPLKDVVPTKADNSVIGTVEDGTNPTKSYAVNEFMVRDGAFCQVTSPVTTSSTWTEGSNYTKKSIAEVIQSLMS